MISKRNVYDLINSSELVHDYFQDLFIRVMRLVKRGQIFKSLDYLLNEISGKSLLVPYLRSRTGSDIIKINVHEQFMCIDLSDGGLSYELLLHLDREPLTGTVFRDYLRSISKRKNNITVIEAGANIGYYALQEAMLLKENGTVHAFEPVPASMDLLQKNISINGFEDQISTIPSAVGSKSGSVKMSVGNARNWARVSTDGQSGNLDVEMTTLDGYCTGQGIDPTTVNIVRMDVEGYETEIIHGMERILSESSDLLLFIELHIRELKSNNELEPFLTQLKEHGFELKAAVRRQNRLEVGDIMELMDVAGCPNVFLHKFEENSP